MDYDYYYVDDEETFALTAMFNDLVNELNKKCSISCHDGIIEIFDKSAE